MNRFLCSKLDTLVVQFPVFVVDCRVDTMLQCVVSRIRYTTYNKVDRSVMLRAARYTVDQLKLEGSKAGECDAPFVSFHRAES